jgi:predicted nuclease of predicted toxin-antitoxin system
MSPIINDIVIVTRESHFGDLGLIVGSSPSGAILLIKLGDERIRENYFEMRPTELEVLEHSDIPLRLDGKIL